MPTTFNVYRNGEKVASQIESKTYTDTDLTPATTYTYTVSATNEHGESNQSNEVSVTTDEEHAPPEDPEELQVSGQTDTTADLEWQ